MSLGRQFASHERKCISNELAVITTVLAESLSALSVSQPGGSGSHVVLFPMQMGMLEVYKFDILFLCNPFGAYLTYGV